MEGPIMADFKDIKVGEKIIAARTYIGQVILTVTKVNKASFVASNDGYTVTFNIENGTERGGGTWTKWYAYKATEEEIEAVRKENRRLNMSNYLSRFNFSTLPYEAVEKIMTIVKENQNKPNTENA